MAKQVNVCCANGVWAYAMWIDGKYDHNDTLDVNSETEAMEAGRALAGADGTVKRVDDVTF